MKEQQKQDSTSTPVSQGNVDSVTQSVALITSFPRIVDVVEREAVKYGDRVETLPIGDGKTVDIDAYFFQSSTNFRLKKIKTALAGLKKQGVKQSDGKDIDSKWFNANVRDPFHKVLKFAAKNSLSHGKPVSLAFTRRTVKATGEQIVTAKHAFEHVTVAPAAKAVEDKASVKATQQSKNRAKRQNRKTKPLTPVVAPSNLARIDALKAGLPESGQPAAGESKAA